MCRGIFLWGTLFWVPCQSVGEQSILFEREGRTGLPHFLLGTAFAGGF